MLNMLFIKLDFFYQEVGYFYSEWLLKRTLKKRKRPPSNSQNCLLRLVKRAFLSAERGFNDAGRN